MQLFKILFLEFLNILKNYISKCIIIFLLGTWVFSGHTIICYFLNQMRTNLICCKFINRWFFFKVDVYKFKFKYIVQIHSFSVFKMYKPMLILLKNCFTRMNDIICNILFSKYLSMGDSLSLLPVLFYYLLYYHLTLLFYI
jgi:hypothetical protein